MVLSKCVEVLHMYVALIVLLEQPCKVRVIPIFLQGSTEAKVCLRLP